VTRRNERWDLVGRGSDPVPTSQFDVTAVARGFERTADGIAEAAGRLERLSRLDGWKGEAAEEFADSAEDSARELRKVQKRYEAIAAAIRAWGGPVERARASTKREVGRAVEADERRRANLHSLLTGVEDPTDAQRAAEERRRERLADAQADLRAAATAVDTAMETLAGDASGAASQIKQASETYKDGRWDRFKGWVRDHADLIDGIANVLKWVTAALAVVVLVLALTIGAPFALLAIAFAAGLALLLADVLLVTSGSGKASWADVAFDVVGVATAGYGLVAVKALTAGSVLARSQLADEVLTAVKNTHLADEAATVTGKLVNNASKIRNPVNNLKVWADGQMAARLQRATDAGKQAAAAALREIEQISPSIAGRLRTLDADLAKALDQLKHMRSFNPSATLTRQMDELRELVHRTVVVGWVSTIGQAAGSTADHVKPVGRAVDDAFDDAVVEPMDDVKHFVLRTVGR
jgi:uncharacterized protein YukE